MTGPVRLSCDALGRLMGEIFARAGVPAGEREIVVEVLLEATMAGYLSHGIMRVPLYVEAIRKGRIHPGARTRVLRRSPSALHLDAGHGLGPVSATEAVGQATGLAAQSGVGCVSVVRAADVARLGSYVIEPAREGFVCLLLVNDAGGNPNVAPWGSTEPFLSTNPLAAGIPRRGAAPIVIDMSTSVAAAGRLRMLAAEGREAPEGWLIDGDGRSSTDPAAALDVPPRAALLPLGGLLAGHKGFALGLLVDVLAGALSGAGCSAGDLDSSDRNGLFVLAVDPGALPLAGGVPRPRGGVRGAAEGAADGAGGGGDPGARGAGPPRARAGPGRGPESRPGDLGAGAGPGRGSGAGAPRRLRASKGRRA